MSTAIPHWDPSSADMTAANSSQYSAAPGLRIIRAPSTAGKSHMPLTKAEAGGKATKARETKP